MAKTFSVAVEQFADISARNMLLVAKQSIQDTIDIAQTPVTKGGHMRIRTGFLRASGQASLTGMPSGPTRGSKGAEDTFKTSGTATYDYEDQTTIAAIGSAKFGDTIYFGWTAVYAKYREPKDGFLATAIQRWPQTVAKNANEVRRRTSGN